uniref:alanine--tRNA ligase n=1 Tax=Oryza glumipatula TaxID=40148 RepID=A0A0D9YHJ0_9ORYZ
MAAPPKWPARVVRETFLSYFESKAHTRCSPSTILAAKDSPLLFADAEMNQFMPVLLGTAAQGSQLGCLGRACKSLRCIPVAVDDRHLTFTEVLGNWSFGDYFKEEAIGFAWELLTKVYELEVDRIFVTYFGGDEKSGLAPDLESKHIWLKYLPSDKVLPLVDKFNKEAGGILMPSSAKHVGTGLNFEQLTSILQKKKSKFDTDILMPTIDSIRQCTGNEIQPYSGKFGPDDINEVDLAYRIVADHIRTSSFAIADGSQPEIEIAKNMLRRAIYFGHQNLKAKQQFLTILVSAFIESMSGDFPELLHNEKKIKDIIAEEEITFAKDKKKFKKKDSKRRKKEKNNTEQNVVVTRPPKVSYKTRTIDFFGRPTHIIHQHENGPCGNVLLLRSEIGLFLNKTEVMEDDLLSRIISHLKRCRKMQFELHEGFQYSEFQHKVLSVAKNLWREVCINVTFKSTDGFVFSPEYALFDYLEIPVFHGWLVDQDSELASAIATSSYDELNLEVGEYISQKEAMGIKGRVEQISDFLQGPQLTAYGLSCLHKDLEEKKPCVLFWNNHWSTVIKFEEELYILASDSSFLSSESGAVWQKLEDVNGGGSFVDSSFTPIKYAGEGASFCSDQARQIQSNQESADPQWWPQGLGGKNEWDHTGRNAPAGKENTVNPDIPIPCHEDLSAVEVVTEEQLPPAEITDVHSSSSTPEVARSDQLKDAAASQTPECSIQAVPYSTPISSPQPLGRQIIAEEERAQLLFGSFGCCDLKYWPSYPTVVCNSDVMAKSVPTVSNKRGFSSFVDKPLYISKASSEHRAQQSAFTNRFLEFLRGFRLGNTEEPYYKGTAASMVFLDLPMMDVKFDHIKIFDNELALMICHDFERSRLDLNYAAKSFIMDFRSQLEGMFMKKFENFDNIIVRIDGLPKIDRLMSLEAFVKLPRNHFVEPRTLFATGSSLTVASGTRVGRIIATGVLQEILKAHASRNSWNGSFKRKNILVRNGCYSEISMPFHPSLIIT